MTNVDYNKTAPIMGNLWSPLCAVTSFHQGRANVQISVSVAAASIVPERPRVVAQIYKTNLSHSMILGSGAFALHFLRPDQLDVIGDFGLVSGRDHDKLAAVDWSPSASQSPLLADCWGYLECRVVNAMDGGDMTCFLAEVLDGGVLSESGPLHWRDARRRLTSKWMARWEQKQSAEIAVSRAAMGDITYAPWERGGLEKGG